MAKMLFDSLSGETVEIRDHVLVVDGHELEEYLRSSEELSPALNVYGTGLAALEADDPDAAEAAVVTGVPLAKLLGSAENADQPAGLHAVVEQELRDAGYTDEGDWPTGDMVEVIAAAVVKHLRG